MSAQRGFMAALTVLTSPVLLAGTGPIAASQPPVWSDGSGMKQAVTISGDATGRPVARRLLATLELKMGDGQLWAPFADAVHAIEKQKIDLLAFTGDQIYEGKPTPADDAIEPTEDSLYRRLLWHWSFRSLTSKTPATVQPDDHDVCQGNIWGWGGRLNLSGFNGEGGYMRSPYFVNAVHRMQTGHLPDAWHVGARGELPATPTPTGFRRSAETKPYARSGAVARLSSAATRRAPHRETATASCASTRSAAP